MGGRARAQTLLRPLPDAVIDALVCQAMATKRSSEPQDKIRELVRLVEAELQARLAEREYKARRKEAMSVGVPSALAPSRELGPAAGGLEVGF